MELTKAVHSDIYSILSLEEECFSHPYSEKLIKSTLDNPMYLIILAKEGNEVLGYAEFGNFVDTVTLDRVAVHSFCRKRGIASLLLSEGEKWAAEKGVNEMSLEVRSANYAARALYEKAGYSNTGTRRRYYRDPTDDALIFNKHI